MHGIDDGLRDQQSLTGLFAVPAGALYLDTASQGPRLRAVQDAAQAALDASVAPWRLSMLEWRASIERVRAAAARLFDGEPDAVALVPSAAYGLAIAARNLPLSKGDAVLVLDEQFPSNLLVWQQRCAEVGARVVAARHGDGHDWTDAVLATIDAERALRVLALPHAYWHDGALLDLDRIAARARDVGAALVLDLSQSLGVLPVDIARWQPDFVVSVGHKWMLGAPGLAYLWAAPRWRGQGVSIEQHWLARDADDWRFPLERAAPYREGARRYDAGGVADPIRLASAEAALRQIHVWGVPRIATELRARTAAFRHALLERGVSDWISPAPVAHFIGVRPGSEELQTALGGALSAAGIVATARHGMVRIAPHLHVGDADMRRVANIIGAVADSANHQAGRAAVKRRGSPICPRRRR